MMSMNRRPPFPLPRFLPVADDFNSKGTSFLIINNTFIQIYDNFGHILVKYPCNYLIYNRVTFLLNVCYIFVTNTRNNNKVK